MSGFFTVSQAAAAIGVTRQAVLLMIDEKRINALWMLEKWAVPESEVMRVKGERRKRLKKAQKAKK